MSTAVKEPRQGRIVPLVDVYTERLEAAPPTKLDAVLCKALGSLHTEGSDVRRILARVPEKRREALTRDIDFNALITDVSDGSRGVFLRQAWHFCGLVPTASFAERAAQSLLEGTLVGAGDASAIPALVIALKAKLAALGPAGRAAFEAAMPSAKPETAAILEQVMTA